jgi:hypothetical protein
VVVVDAPPLPPPEVVEPPVDVVPVVSVVPLLVVPLLVVPLVDPVVSVVLPLVVLPLVVLPLWVLPEPDAPPDPEPLVWLVTPSSSPLAHEKSMSPVANNNAQSDTDADKDFVRLMMEISRASRPTKGKAQPLSSASNGRESARRLKKRCDPGRRD